MASAPRKSPVPKKKPDTAFGASFKKMVRNSNAAGAVKAVVAKKKRK